MSNARSARALLAALAAALLAALCALAALAPAAAEEAGDDLPKWAEGYQCYQCHVAEAEGMGVEVVDPVLLPEPAEEADGADKPGAADEGAEEEPADEAAEADGAEAAEGGPEDAAGEEPVDMAAAHAVLDCQFCHPDNDDMDWAHYKPAQGTPPTELSYTKVESDLCLACHKAAYTPESTEGVEITDGIGTSCNPHDLPAAGGSHDSVGCIDCHNIHGQGEAGKMEPAELAYSRCIDCHHMDQWGCVCHDH